MGNVRGKLPQAGCLEALVNAGKRSKYKPRLAAPHKGIMKARHGEVNYLPDTAAGTDIYSAEELQNKLQECMMATTKDSTTTKKTHGANICQTTQVNNRTTDTCQGSINSVAGTVSSKSGC
jgi:hypothetical protein